jgi:DNA (cytosine-5)-methyltransferase 1
MKHGSLFSGIGGFDLAAEWAGWENVFHCEWNPFGQRVLKHYWPNAESFNDITKSDFSKYEYSVDIISGGFPCQPFSTAGQRRGTDDTRYLWPAMLDVIRTVKPRYVVGENVHGLVNWNKGMVFDTICADLEAQGYEVQAFLLPAAAVNAPHKRYRIWFVAYNMCNGRTQHTTDKHPAETGIDAQRQFAGLCVEGYAAYSNNKRQKQKSKDKKSEVEIVRFIEPNERTTWHSFPSEPALCGGNDGLPKELDGITFPKWREETLKAYGNAIVPQVAFQIFNAINEYERLYR